FDVIYPDHLHLEAEAFRHRSAALQFLESAVSERDRDRAVLLEAGGLCGLPFESFEKAGRVFGKLGQIAGGPQLADESRRMPGGAAGKLLPFKEHGVADA